jgi:hypothetical protein
VTDLPYLVELWFDPDMNRREETIATAGHVKVARAAYNEAMKLYPARLVTLSNRSMILARSDRPEPAAEPDNVVRLPTAMQVHRDTNDDEGR